MYFEDGVQRASILVKMEIHGGMEVTYSIVDLQHSVAISSHLINQCFIEMCSIRVKPSAEGFFKGIEQYGQLVVYTLGGHQWKPAARAFNVSCKGILEQGRRG